MREGTPGDSFCILIEGQVNITRQGWQLCTLERGVSFGEMTFLRPDAPIRTATAVSESEVLVLKVPNPALRGASDTLQSCFDRPSSNCWWAAWWRRTSRWRNGSGGGAARKARI